MEYTTLSPLAMFVNAGPVGKLVMLTLVLASVYTWVLIVSASFPSSDWQGDPLGARRRRRRRVGSGGAAARPRMDLPGESIGEKRERIAE